MNEPDPVLILTTGGTIEKQYFDALSRYQIGDSQVPRLLAIARVKQPHRIEEVLRKDSLDLTDDDREAIVDRVRRTEFNRIIIVHGTDTMTLTARALEAISGKTIVLTGALTPALFIESDAAFNLGMAFAAVQTAPLGVYIAFNGSLFRGAEAVKDRDRGCFIGRL
jgi:L-asparaginase